MSAVPSTASSGQHQFVVLSQLTPSPLNHRKTFPADKMAELTASVSARGVIQPIIVRPLAAGGFEVVAGERRYRAAKAAKHIDIPAIVRELTDIEVLEYQVIENGQREDPHPLEEAEGYEALLAAKRTDGQTYSVEEIAAKINKSRSYIFGRLKLCALCPEARKAFYAGDVDASKALLIARIAHHDTQRQALKDLTRGRHGNGDAMSFREAHSHILQNFMLKLSTAPFDIKDEKLVAKAGACGPCPKRTGNQADLFDDVKSADVCTDPKCFDDKRKAHFGVAARALEAEGFKVISGDAAKKLIPGWEHRTFEGSYINLSGGYEKFDGTSYASGRNVTVRTLFDKDYKPTKLQHPVTGQVLDVVTQQAITAAVAKRKRSAPAKATRARSAGPGKKQLGPKEILEERLKLEIFRKLPLELGRAELQLLAGDALNTTDGVELIANELVPLKTADGKHHDWRSASQALMKAIPKMAVGDLARIIMAVTVIEACYTERLLADAARRYKVDPAKVKKTIAEEEKAKAVAKKVRPAKKAAKGKPTKKRAIDAILDVEPPLKVQPVITPLIRPMGDPLDVAKKKPAARKKPNAAFMKPMQPSAALAVITGDKPMPRAEVTSKVWGYIKKKGLQDKINRRMINSDESLAPIFNNKKQVSMFEMTKLIAKHLK